MAKRGRKTGSRYMYCRNCQSLLAAVPGEEKICGTCGKMHTAKQVDKAIKNYEDGR